MKLESRHPAVEDTAGLQKITAQLKGKRPASLHALCDMLDAEAARQAEAKGLTVVGVAGDAVEDEIEEQRSVQRLVTEKPAKLGGEPVTKNVMATETVKIQVLSRDYWCAKA